MKSLLLITTLFSLFCFANPALAMDLDSARKSKKVVELPSGFVEAKDPSTAALVKSVNAKRKKAYQAIAKKTKTSPAVVGAQAHKKIMKKLKGK